MNTIASIGQLHPGTTATPLARAEQGAPSVSIPAAELRELNVSQLGADSATSAAPTSFASVLSNLVQDVNAKQNIAGQALQALQSGQNVSLHQAMIASEEAGVSFQLMVEVRNRLVDSYQELMRMSA